MAGLLECTSSAPRHREPNGIPFKRPAFSSHLLACRPPAQVLVDQARDARAGGQRVVLDRPALILDLPRIDGNDITETVRAGHDRGIGSDLTLPPRGPGLFLRVSSAL